MKEDENMVEENMNMMFAAVNLNTKIIEATVDVKVGIDHQAEGRILLVGSPIEKV